MLLAKPRYRCELTFAIWLIGFSLAIEQTRICRAAADEQSDNTKPAAAAVDSLGDPLPEGARLRFGTMRFRPPSGVDDIALSPDNKSLVTFGRDIIVWNATTGEERWRANPSNTGFSSPGGAAYG